MKGKSRDRISKKSIGGTRETNNISGQFTKTNDNLGQSTEDSNTNPDVRSKNPSTEHYNQRPEGQSGGKLETLSGFLERQDSMTSTDDIDDMFVNMNLNPSPPPPTNDEDDMWDNMNPSTGTHTPTTNDIEDTLDNMNSDDESDASALWDAWRDYDRELEKRRELVSLRRAMDQIKSGGPKTWSGFGYSRQDSNQPLVTADGRLNLDATKLLTKGHKDTIFGKIKGEGEAQSTATSPELEEKEEYGCNRCRTRASHFGGETCPNRITLDEDKYKVKPNDGSSQYR